MCPDLANIEETYENVKLTNLIDDFFVSDYEFSAPPPEANSPDVWINPKEHPKLIYFIDSFLKYMKDLFDCVYTNKKKKKKTEAEIDKILHSFRTFKNTIDMFRKKVKKVKMLKAFKMKKFLILMN